MRATYLAHLTPFDLIIVLIFGAKHKLADEHNSTFSSVVLFTPLMSECSPQHLLSSTQK